MNVFTGDVFWHNRHFLGSYHCNIENDLGIRLDQELTIDSAASFDRFAARPIAAFYSYRADRDTRCIVSGRDRDLERLRIAHAITGYTMNVVTIFGSNWPDGLADESSGFGMDNQEPWWMRKLHILQSFRFNICMENTAAKYYCTEKIWHSIVAGCLPIYSSRDTAIYETFPIDSFVDASSFETSENLFSFVMSMSRREFVRRLDLCVDCFNKQRLYRLSEKPFELAEQQTQILNHFGEKKFRICAY